ncbi:GNAT family N-acetyltransferase [Thiotrichales bacterium 19S3-7]|nr:GNAT family N-acetyltransferase [Thiotrichales bacterium 19S3-7]MCF6801520.1 GNAT family N-acetyltransferase [Thiotrichales bacterium 19S3-11]
MFADKSLAKQIEALMVYNARQYTLASRKLYPQLQAACIDVDDGIASFCGEDDRLSKAIGIGLSGKVTKETLALIEQIYAKRNASTVIDLCPLADSSILYFIKSRCYALSEYLNVMYLDLSKKLPEFALPSDIIIEQTDDIKLWHAVTVLGYTQQKSTTSYSLSRYFDCYATMDHVTAFTAKLDGVVVGGSVVAIGENGICEFNLSATLLDFRGRGVQRALIAKRIEYAKAHGCKLVVACFTPGSIPQRNFERFGFRLAYTRTKLVKALSEAK